MRESDSSPPGDASSIRGSTDTLERKLKMKRTRKKEMAEEGNAARTILRAIVLSLCSGALAHLPPRQRIRIYAPRFLSREGKKKKEKRGDGGGGKEKKRERKKKKTATTTERPD